MTREKYLKEKGWERMSTLDEPRLSEAIELYKEIGFEVHLEPLHPEEEKNCTECMHCSPQTFSTIYIRKKLRTNHILLNI